MKPEDEILLTDYLEGDLESSKVEYVEKLLKEDAKAQKLMNQLKKAEIEIDSVLNSDAFNKLDKKVSTFLESKFSENKLIDSLKSFFIPQALLGYALTGVVFFNIGTGGLSFTPEYIDGFNYEEPFKKTYFKFRGSDNSDIDQYLEEAIRLMANEKKGTGKITYGSEEITITLINQKISEDDLNCFEGSEQRQNLERQFLFCNSQEVSSLLFKSKK
ncbi:MAG: hypothetical protein ACJ0F4_01925 [Gammaproteobacteria bacterium]